MSKQPHQYQKRRAVRSYFGIVFSVSLILFVVGVLSLLLLNARQVSQHVKEQIVLTIFIDDNAKEVEVSQLETMLTLAPFSRSVVYISKEQAATEHSADIGEDFMDFLGYNPLKDAIDLRLKGDYVTTHRVDSISAFLAEKTFVSDIVYDRPLVNLLNENIEKARLLLSRGHRKEWLHQEKSCQYRSYQSLLDLEFAWFFFLYKQAIVQSPKDLKCLHVPLLFF